MKNNFIYTAIITVLSITITPKVIAGVEFIGMPAPTTASEKANIYTKAQLKYVDSNGLTHVDSLKYHQLMATTQKINDKVVGGLFDVNGTALTDLDGQMASDAPDGTSLLEVANMPNALTMVTQYEYKSLPPNDGISSGGFWSKLPAAMSVAKLEQNKVTGKLKVTDYNNIDFSSVKGGWIHCGSTRSAWNTHLGSEEYEPDAKTYQGLEKASDSDDDTDIKSFSQYYFADANKANPYHYGLVPEISVDNQGKPSVVKHYATGRFAREMLEMATDKRTAINGDDGKNTGLFMFVADNSADLSAGSLYAAKLTQLNANNGGSYRLQWIKLGQATDAEIQALVNKGIKFTDIFEVSNTDPNNNDFKKVVTYNGTEWLRLKPGMDKAAAFLETRRFAAYKGATTEFSKMEYIAFNQRDKKFYLVISRVEAGMADTNGDIQVARNDGGVIFEMHTQINSVDTTGQMINSRFVGNKLTPIAELVGGWNGGVKDAEGNQCQQDKICGPDNLRYVDSIRTLFIGEDTSRRNNNYVWAFNIDSRKLSRILSVPMGAEATGLTVVPNFNGFGYIMSNFQHAGENDLPNYLGANKARVLSAINRKWNNRKKAAIGYIGLENSALPTLY